MKKCGKCRKDLELSQFSFRNKSKDVRMSWCKLCVKSYDRERQNSKIYLDRKYELVKARQEIAREYIWRILSGNSCKDCGNENPIVLQFDHIDPKEKSYNVSEMLNNSLQMIQEEIDKCEIRCANCHTVKTFTQFGFWKVLRTNTESTRNSK